MSFVKRGLSLIPRPIVNLFPRATRDRLRTALLRREQGRQRRKAARAKKQGLMSASDSSHTAAAEISAVADAIQRIDTRLTEIVLRLDQLDSRISTAVSGDAPSALDDLGDLIKPIQRLQETLENVQVPDNTTRSPQ